MSNPHYDIHPSEPRWTHIALRVDDIDASIAWYQEFTPLELLDTREDADGRGAWLGMPDTQPNPFILVIAQFNQFADLFGVDEKAVLRPFSHLGIELPNQADVDAVAERGRRAGCLAMAPRLLPKPIGYICMLHDPDQNLVEFSWDQGVYAIAQERWGRRATTESSEDPAS